MDFKMDASEYSLIDIDKLRDLAVENSDSYRKKQPFPHAIFDCVYSEKMLDKVIKEFRNSDDSWREFNTKYEKKSQLCVEDDLGPVTRSLIHNLNSGPFLNFLEDLTGISGLIPDPYLVGGGLHKISQGGKLGIHVDFNKHKTMNVFRRINVIIYLNKDWKDEYGGHLELWDKEKTNSITKILPIFNRMVVFNTSSKSFHGHPEPLKCPKDIQRMSLALYFYTADEPGNQSANAHSTLFLNERNEAHSIGRRSRLKRFFGWINRYIGSKKS